jgi:hypothetical protein
MYHTSNYKVNTNKIIKLYYFGKSEVGNNVGTTTVISVIYFPSSLKTLSTCSCALHKIKHKILITRANSRNAYLCT